MREKIYPRDNNNKEGQSPYLLGKLLIEELGISGIKQQVENAPRLGPKLDDFLGRP